MLRYMLAFVAVLLFSASAGIAVVVQHIEDWNDFAVFARSLSVCLVSSLPLEKNTFFVSMFNVILKNRIITITFVLSIIYYYANIVQT